MFKLSLTFPNPSVGNNPQRGFPTPGAGLQSVSDGTPSPDPTYGSAVRPTQGKPTWFKPTSSAGRQRGFGSPQSPQERRPPGSMPNVPPVYGGAIQVWTPYYSRGAAAFVQNFGKVLTNPIGNGVVANYRPQASYGPGGQFVDNQIFWASQAIPTSVGLQGLVGSDQLLALLGTTNVQAVLRTTG